MFIFNIMYIIYSLFPREKWINDINDIKNVIKIVIINIINSLFPREKWIYDINDIKNVIMAGRPK